MEKDPKARDRMQAMFAKAAGGWHLCHGQFFNCSQRDLRQWLGFPHTIWRGISTALTNLGMHAT